MISTLKGDIVNSDLLFQRVLKKKEDPWSLHGSEWSLTPFFLSGGII